MNVKNWTMYLSLVMLLSSCSLLKKAPVRPPAAASKASPSRPGPSRGASLPISSSARGSAEPVPEPDNEITNVPPITPELFYGLQFKYAILLDRTVEEMQDHQFLSFLEQWYGTPYRMGGSDTTGIDCSGFVQQYMSYRYRLNLPRTSRNMYEACRRVPVDAMQEGDLVFFHIQRRRVVSHVGVYLGNNKFVHASTKYGVVISDLNDPYYREHFAGAGSFR